jgi:hypothetical protein
MPLKFDHIKAALAAPPKTKQTWSGVEVVDHFKAFFDIPETGPWGYPAWLRHIKANSVTIHQAKQLTRIMSEREAWLLKNKGEQLHRGKWMFNRFRKEIKEMGVDKFISANSR